MNIKMALIALSTIIMIMSACGAETTASEVILAPIPSEIMVTESPTLTESTYHNITYTYDADNEIEVNGGRISIYFDTNCFAGIDAYEAPAELNEEYAEEILTGIKDGQEGNFESSVYENIIETNIAGIEAWSIGSQSKGGNGDPYEGDYGFKFVWFSWGNELYAVYYCSPQELYDANLNKYEDIVYSIKLNEIALEETETPLPEIEVAEEMPEPEPENNITIGQQNALEAALRYLDVMAFSYDGLVEQLEYSEYAYIDAVYGADNCGADWNEQAAKKAKSYLDLMALSRNRLIEQLIHDGFTEEQAEYGAAQNGY